MNPNPNPNLSSVLVVSMQSNFQLLVISDFYLSVISSPDITNMEKYSCTECNKTFSTQYNRDRHETTMHDDSIHSSESEQGSHSSSDVEEESEMRSQSASDVEEESEAESQQTQDESEEEHDDSWADSVNAFHVRLCDDIDQDLLREFEDTIQDLQDTDMGPDVETLNVLKDMAARLDKDYRKSLVEFLIQCHHFQKLPHVSMLLKKAEALEKKGFDADSALWAAMSRRKHLFRPFHHVQRRQRPHKT